MLDQGGRTVRISLILMTIASYMSLATTDAFGPEITLVPFPLLFGMPIFERIDVRFAAYRRFTSVVTLAFIILIIPYLLRDLLSALTLTVVYIQVYLFLHHKTVRDYRYLFLMAFFLLVDAVAQGPDPAFGLVMPLFILSAVWAFGSLQVYAETLANEGGNIADLLPSEPRRGFLPPEVAMWIAGDKRDTMNIAPVLTALSIACVLGSMLLFLLTPRMEAGVFGRSNYISPASRSDVSDRVDLSRGGTIAADETTVFMARFPKEPNGQPNIGALYWRVTTFNHLVGAEWGKEPASLDRGTVDARSYDGGTVVAKTERGDGRIVEQEVFLENTEGMPGIPALSNAVKLTMQQAGRVAWDQGDATTILLIRSANKSLQYLAESEVRDLPISALRAAPANYEETFGGGRQRDLRIFTDERISQRSRALAKNITNGLSSPYDMANAIHNYLRANYVYSSTNLAELSADDPIDAFLFDKRVGHCELYASAMCMLVRSLGIPARVVSGFRDGEWSPTDRAYIVRKKHAHLWVEVYLNGIGWWTFDPSGDATIDNSPWAVMQRSLTRYALNAKVVYYRDLVGFSGGIRAGDIMNFTIGLFAFDFDTMKQTLPSLKFFAAGLPRIVLLILLICGVTWGVYVLYHSARSKKLSAVPLAFTEDQVRATRLYGRLRGRLHRLGAPGAAKSARELIDEVESDPRLDAATVAKVVRAYNDVRFGGRKLTRSRYQELLRTINTLRRAQADQINSVSQ